jgi:adenosylmethionine-8-amino-7-oxononanoate aminotransferase
MLLAEYSRGRSVVFALVRSVGARMQAMCLSLGHTPPPPVVEAITRQLVELPFAYNGVASVPIRGKLSKLLASVCPGVRAVVQRGH